MRFYFVLMVMVTRWCLQFYVQPSDDVDAPSVGSGMHCRVPVGDMLGIAVRQLAAAAAAAPAVCPRAGACIYSMYSSFWYLPSRIIGRHESSPPLFFATTFTIDICL